MTATPQAALPLSDLLDVLQETIQEIGEHSLSSKGRCVSDGEENSDHVIVEEVMVCIQNAITGEEVARLSDLPGSNTVWDLKVRLEDVLGQGRFLQRIMVPGAVEAPADHVRIDSLGTSPLQIQWARLTWSLPHDEDCCNALHFAARRGDCVVVLGLLKAAAWPDCKDSTGCTPLHLAAKTDDNIEVVRLLCEAGAAKDLRTNRGETALLTAVDNWALCIAGFLCESGACTNLADNMGWTALGLAVKAANVASVRSLVRAGAKVNGSASPNGMIPLALLIVHAHLALSGIGLTSVLTKIASLLCEAGAAWGDKMPDGRTPLEIAYKTGHEETDRFFVPLEMQQAGNG